MSDIDLMGKALDSKVVAKAYDDVGSPGFKELGKVGADLVKTARLFLLPLQIAATFQDRFEKFLREFNERIPDDRKIEIAPEISGSAIESMRYQEEDSVLWKLFKEILFKAGDSELVGLVHPSFVQIVKQLTRDEAHILFRLKDTEFTVVDKLDFNKTKNEFSNRRVETTTIPEGELWNPAAINIYYAHLESLSLVEWPVTKQEPIMVGGTQTGLRRFSKMKLTEFGALFVAASLPPEGIEE